ncbi:MAG: aminopeptidase P N-terminal domain-containing protein [Deltaproteobacteria bacterium]|nr:aminopeptidase P N-terminal domain-containing protein [Deltaproteobacteria bacterium]
MDFPYKQRIARIKRELKAQGGDTALLISSASPVPSSRDMHHPFRQSSDFYYLTGSLAADMALLIKSSAAKPVLFYLKPDPVRLLWEGKQEDGREVARRIGAEARAVKDFSAEILSQLRGTEALYYQNEAGTVGARVATYLFALGSHERGKYPNIFLHSDVMLERMRLIKERGEIKAIYNAAQVAIEALFSCLDTIQPGVSESHITASIDYVMGLHGCKPAFNTIVACGPSASVLHYHSGTRRLKSGDMLLVDWGASFKMYCSDITRTLPVGASFNEIQRDLYLTVLTAQERAIQKVRHGAKISAIYDAAARTITEGLLDIGVLKGKLSKLMEQKAYKTFFPHGIGHSVGLDAHDIGNLRGNNEAVLEAGMVFTVEPGVYFARKKGRVPACGIRIEDTVAVTPTGCEVLTAAFPKKIDEIEALMEEAQGLEIL